MAQTIGFGDLQNQGDNNQNGQDQSQGQNSNQNSNVQDVGATNPPAGAQGGANTVSSGGKPGDQYKPEAYSQKSQGTGYTNIQRVVQANRPQQLQQAVAGNISGASQQGIGNVNQASQQFQGQTAGNQANTAANQQLVQNVLNDPTKFSQAQANPASGATNAAPTAGQNVYGTNSAVGQQGTLFTQLLGGQYGGPQALANQDQLAAQTQALRQMGQGLGTSGGQQSILQGVMGNNPQYSRGQQTLDALLLGQGNSQALTQARRQALGATDVLGQAQAGAAEQAKEGTAGAQAFGQQVQGQFGSTVSGADKALQDQATAAQTARDTKYQQTLADIKTGNITQEEADLLGLTSGQNVYNVLNDPSKFLSESALKANAQNVAGTQDYAKMQALQQLAGGYTPGAAQDVFKQYQDPSQAGKFAADKGIIGDTTGFQSALGKTSQEYNSVLQPAQANAARALDVYNMTVARDRAGGPYSPGGAAIQAQILAKYGPGIQNGGTTRTDWAATESQKANAALAAAQANLNAAYGSPMTINITPQQKAQQDEIAANAQNLGQEKGFGNVS